jgi:hypothetical protein
VPWSTPTQFTAILTDTSNTGTPVAGKTIIFTGTGVIPSTLSTTTDSTGKATVRGTSPSTIKTGWTYQAKFAGDPLYNLQNSVIGAYNTIKHSTSLTLAISPTAVPPLGKYGISGMLTDISTYPSPTPLRKMTIKFTATSPIKIGFSDYRCIR